MRLRYCLLSLCAALTLTACAREAELTSTNATQSNAPAGGKTSIAHGTAADKPGVPPLASSHGGATPGSIEQDRALLDTSALDAKIQQAVTKAKAGNASAADKRAAADAYLERATLYWGAQNTALYKFALADYKSVLIYDPGNEEAKERMDYIISIYKQLGRPVPQVSNEK